MLKMMPSSVNPQTIKVAFDRQYADIDQREAHNQEKRADVSRSFLQQQPLPIQRPKSLPDAPAGAFHGALDFSLDSLSLISTTRIPPDMVNRAIRDT
jgi:hypothetical protein